ncbi:hypothetical protein MXB_138 [Myxobolus squamalis]|nr:hypothetical protein MXB_138 [Myxobolus squamalis]
MDNHRPYNLQNIYSAETVRLIINNNENLEDVPKFETLFESVCSENTHISNKKSDTIEKKYERFFYHGSPSAITMFDIASKLGKDILEYVWFALCGLTELFILRKLTREKYICDIMYLQQQVLRLSTSNNDPSACFSINSDSTPNLFLHSLEFNGKLTNISAHFVAFSNMVNKWWEKTVQFFSRHGVQFKNHLSIPLSQCKQSFTSMESDIRNSSKNLIMKHSTKYGLHDISYPSFVAQFGYRCKITAADYVLTLISAIDYCSKNQENRSSSFLSALEILNILNVSRLENQIQVAKSMLSSIATNVGYFVDLHYIICAGPFLFGAATEDREQQRFISNPLILDIISYYALLSHSTLTKSKRAKELPKFCDCWYSTHFLFKFTQVQYFS